MQKLLISLTIVALLTAACTAHRIPVQQGNIVTREQLGLLKPGLEKRQVVFILGNPLVQDPFHADRWDYFYSFSPQEGKPSEQYRLTLYFDGDRLSRFETEGDIPESGPEHSPDQYRTGGGRDS